MTKPMPSCWFLELSATLQRIPLCLVCLSILGCQQILVAHNPDETAGSSDQAGAFPQASPTMTDPDGVSPPGSEQLPAGTNPLDPAGPPSPGTTKGLFNEALEERYLLHANATLALALEPEEGSIGPLEYKLLSPQHPEVQLLPGNLLVFEPGYADIGTTLEFQVAATAGGASATKNLQVEILDPYEGMLRIEGLEYPFFIDPYEAVVSYTPDCAPDTFYGQETDDYHIGFPNEVGGAEGGPPTEYQDLLYACSLPAVLPSRFITFLQARTACDNVGKRLCTRQEFLYACRETENKLCNWRNGAPQKTGAASGCQSIFGVYDLSGNLKEWIDQLICEPESENDPCLEQCRLHFGAWWCEDPIRLALLRSHAPIGVGFDQAGGFFEMNGSRYAACTATEPQVADDARPSTGFRCCKSAPKAEETQPPVTQLPSDCTESLDDPLCTWCALHAPPGLRQACLSCYRGPDLKGDNKKVRWIGNECICVNGYAPADGCVRSEAFTTYCAPFRSQNHGECERCQEHCGPGTTWTDADSGVCRNSKGQSIKSWDNCQPCEGICIWQAGDDPN